MTYLQKDVDEFLDHHGVKGQKWGVRNKQRIKAGVKLVSIAAVTLGGAFAVSILTKHGKNKAHDYGYTNSTIDIGPMGLDNLRFGSGRKAPPSMDKEWHDKQRDLQKNGKAMFWNSHSADWELGDWKFG